MDRDSDMCFIDYTLVSSIVSNMEEVAGDIFYAYNIMNYSNPISKNSGLFADEFDELRAETQRFIADMRIFIEQYAKMVLDVSQNYEQLDLQLSNMMK